MTTKKQTAEEWLNRIKGVYAPGDYTELQVHKALAMARAEEREKAYLEKGWSLKSVNLLIREAEEKGRRETAKKIITYFERRMRFFHNQEKHEKRHWVAIQLINWRSLKARFCQKKKRRNNDYQKANRRRMA